MWIGRYKKHASEIHVNMKEKLKLKKNEPGELRYKQDAIATQKRYTSPSTDKKWLEKHMALPEFLIFLRLNL